MDAISSLCYEMVKKLGKGDLQREEVLHSKRHELIQQELWKVLIGYTCCAKKC